MMPMKVGRAMQPSWTGGTRFQFSDFRASIVSKCLATPFSHVNALAITSAVKLA
jgi:hypothetical protein